MNVFFVPKGDEMQRIASYLEMDEMTQLGGLAPQAIIGVLAPDDSLIVNSIFRLFLHEIIAQYAPLDPDVQRAAQGEAYGRLVYIDARVPEGTHPVRDEDILGWFQVREGRIVDGSYRPNPRHRIDGANGLTAAIGAFRQSMVDTLLLRCESKSPPSRPGSATNTN